jgi:hypothetical protein
VLPLSGCLKGFITLGRQKNPGIVFTHCFLHREALISKSVIPEVLKLLNKTNKMVNYTKSRPLQLRWFLSLCSAMEAAYTQLLQHAELRWLSRGFYELTEELKICSCLKSLSWLTCLVMRPGAIKLLS